MNPRLIPLLFETGNFSLPGPARTVVNGSLARIVLFYLRMFSE